MVYNKNLSIELLRFLLSVFVVFHHQAWLVFGKTFDLDSGFQYAFYLFQGSVDVFFVISGFYTIKSILNKKPFEFLRHRFARIFPLYTLVCIAVAVVAIYKPSLFNSMPTENIIEILSKSIFFIPFKIDSFQGPILSVGWTLNYEVWFYIFIFLSSIIFKSVKILYIFTCYFVLTLFFIFIKQEKFIFNFIWLEFIMGMFLYQKFEFINTLFNRHIFSFCQFKCCK